MENKYETVISHIKEKIREGRLKPGGKLPSIREMCLQFQCSKATVIRAFDELERTHILYSKPKSGYYVIESTHVPLESNQAGEVIDFSPAVPDPEALPYIDFQHCLNQAIDIYKDTLFGYADPQGLAELRKALECHHRNRQVFATRKDIFVTSGSQQALYILSAIPFPNGKSNVLVEQPTFGGMLKALQLLNVNTLGIARTADGIDFSELERIFRGGSIKFFYTIPRFQNPTGFSYTNEQKKRILALAEKYDVYIVEDDYLAGLETDTRSDPMHAYDTCNRVIYVKSYSKTLLPGLRIGSVILPKLLQFAFLEHKKSCDITTSVLSQGALEIYIRSGMYDAHCKKIRQFYQDRMHTLAAAAPQLAKQNVICHIPRNGFFALFELPEQLKSETLLANLQQRQVYLVNAEKMYLPGFRKDNAFRLSICRTNQEKIEKGIRIIAEEVQRSLNRAPAHKKSPVDL